MTRSPAAATKSTAAPEARPAAAPARESARPLAAGPVWAGTAGSAIAVAGAVQCTCSCGGGADTPCATCAGHEKIEPVRRRALDDRDNDERWADAGAVRSQLGPGVPIDSAMRGHMERAFGRDFSRVRLHTDSAAERLAKQFSARAFTSGEHIAFGRGQYQPASRGGEALIAHELTHVAQQQDGVSGRGPTFGSYRSFEAQAERTASVVARGGLAPALSPAPAQIQRDEDEEEEKRKTKGLAEVPAASMTASFYGLTFRPPGGSTLTLETSWARQITATAIKRLIGSSYVPGQLEDEAISKFGLKGEGGLSPSAEEKAIKENKPKNFDQFLFKAKAALEVVLWLRNDKHLVVEIAKSQEELLWLGLTLPDLWKDLQQAAIDGGEPLPGWYSESLFTLDMNSFGTLLRQYFEATTASDTERRTEVAAMLDDALTPSLRAVDAIRADAKLTGEWEYRLLWYPGKKADEAPNAVAPPDTAVGLGLMHGVLMFVRTQPYYMERAPLTSAEGAEARRELLKRTGRFEEHALPGGSGDQKLLDKPGSTNARPFTANLTAYPPLIAPMYDANKESEYAFTMHIGFNDVFDAMASYSYRFELIEVPQGDKLAQGISYKPSRTDLLKHRLSRDTRYNIADAKRMVGNMEKQFGAPSLVVVELIGLNSLMRYVGTLISSVFEALLDPKYVARFTFPHEGMYLLRCMARAHTSETAEIIRPPSIAYLPVWARDPELVAETQLQSEVESSLGDQQRLKEIDEELKANPDDKALLAEKDRILRQQTVEGSLNLAKEDLTAQKDKAATDEEKAAIQERIEKIDEILTMRDKRGLKGSTAAELIHATFIGDNGQLVRLLIEAVDKSDSDWPPTHRRYYVSDATTANSGHSEAEATVSGDAHKKGRTARAAAILQAIVNILEGTMGYGRGYVAVLIDSQSRSQRIEADENQILLEGISNAATVLSIAAIAAAPFTGGGSLTLLIPIGVVGAIPSAYRLISRAEAGNLRWDLSTAMDIVNIASAALPWGGEMALARKATIIGGAMLITGIGANALGVVLMGVDLVEQLNALGELPPELRGPRAAEIIGGAMLQAGIMVGAMLASHSKIQEKGAGPREFDLARWKESLSDETRTQLKNDPDLFARFSEMPSRVRELLTHCSDYCLPTKVTKKQAETVASLLERHKLTPSDERALKAYFYDNRETLGDAIKTLDDFTKVKDLRAYLAAQVGPADAVLLAFTNLRKDPALRALAESVAKKGAFSIRELGDVMDQAQKAGSKASRILGYLDMLSDSKAVGKERVVADLAKGHNFFTGAEWVLRWIDESGMWSEVKRFEVESETAGRRWDAQIGENLYQFKNWSKFWESSFLKQILQDFQKSNNLKTFEVRWVFDPRIGDVEAVKTMMRTALDKALSDGKEGFTSARVRAIKAALDGVVLVGS
jgi:hypothetical protein